MRRKQLTLLLALSLLLTQTRSAPAQTQNANAAPAAAQAGAPQPARSDKQIEKIKRVVNKVGIGHRITVFLKNGDELHGTPSRIGAEDFDVAEVDLQRTITVRYEYVKKVREGYGNFNLFTGSRTSPRKGTKIGILAGVMFTTIGLPLILLSTMDD